MTSDNRLPLAEGPASHGGAFTCPLRSYELPTPLTPFDSFDACNAAVAAYQGATGPGEQDQRAEEIFARLLPLVRKSLRRFCHPFYEESRCYSGACYPEELMGESYLWFREALDTFDTALGVDFVGFLGQRLFWAGEHRVRGLRRNWNTPSIEGLPEEVSRAEDSEEDRLLGRALADSLLSQLDARDAQLARRSSEGFTSRELAEWAGTSEAAVRKRLERIRERLRQSVEKARPGA